MILMINDNRFRSLLGKLVGLDQSDFSMYQCMRYCLFIVVSLLSYTTVDAQCKEVGYFNKIKLYAEINVVCRTSNDSIGWVSYKGIDSESNVVTTIVNSGTMTIYLNTIDYKELPDTLFVFYPDLISVENAYNSTLAIDTLSTKNKVKCVSQGNGKIQIGYLKAHDANFSILTGKGEISVDAGYCDNIFARIVGTGKIKVSGLKSVETVVRCLGTGSISCPQSEIIKIKGLGTTKIFYKGHPVIKRWGNARVINLNAMD